VAIAANALSKINKSEWEQFQTQQGGMIKDLNATMLGAPTLADIPSNIQQGVADTEAAHGRALERYGASYSNAQRAARKKALGLSTATSTANAMNVGRRNAAEERKNSLASMVGIRQNLVGQAQQGLGASANMAGERSMDYQTRKAGAKQQNIQLASSVAMGLLMMSSRSYKDNIQDYGTSDALKLIEEIDLVSFDYKPEVDAPRGMHIGVIAEDVPAVLATTDRKEINAYNIIGVLLGAVQELTKQVNDLKGEA
jgi:hypothetical protein